MPAPVQARQKESFLDLDRMFRIAVDHPIAVKDRRAADIATQFYQGQQWQPDELAVLKKRNQPEITENEILPTIERLKGQFRKQKTTIKFLGRNAPDEQVGQILSDLMRHVDQTTGFEFVEGEAVQDQLVSGIGWVELYIQRDEAGNHCIRARREDRFAMFKDPFSRDYDLQDARFLCRSKWLSEDQGNLLWPGKAGLIRQCLSTQYPSQSTLSFFDPEVLKDRNWFVNYYDYANRRFRPVEIWYKKRVLRRVLVTKDGTTVDLIDLSKERAYAAKQEIPGAYIEEDSYDEMWHAVFCGGIILEDPKPHYLKCNLFPFVPYRAYICADGRDKGYAEDLIPIQRDINARRSKALYEINNRQVIYERNAVHDQAELADEMALADGQIVLEPGKMDKFQIRENTDISQGNLSMLQESKIGIRRISGEDQIAQFPDIRSGSGLARAQSLKQDGVIPLYDNIRRSRRMKAALVFELIKQFYTDEYVFQITDDPNAARTIRLKQDHLDAFKQYTFDIVATDAPITETVQAEQYEMLATTLPQILQFGPQWAEFLIAASELRNKEGLIQKIQQMSQPPPLMPKVNVSLMWAELPPAEKLAWAVEWGNQQLAAAIQQGNALPVSQMNQMAEIKKTQIKAAADVQKAVIAHSATRHGHAVQLETAAMGAHTAMYAADKQAETAKAKAKEGPAGE